MKRFFRNIPWKNVLIIALVVVLGVGAVAGIASIAKNDSKTISSAVFKRGAVDSNGFYVENDTSIYTKNLIECQGLEIVPDFEATGSYQVFYYSINKRFIGATELMDSSSYGVYTKGDDFALAHYCRIMIIPETPKDDFGNTIKDYKIKFYEVAGIANKFTISVNKNQIAHPDYEYDVTSLERCMWTISDNKILMTTGEFSGSLIDLTDIKDIYNTVVFENESLDSSIKYTFLTTDQVEDGGEVPYCNGYDSVVENTIDEKVVVKIPSDAVILYVYNYSQGSGSFLPEGVVFTND